MQKFEYNFIFFGLFLVLTEADDSFLKVQSKRKLLSTFGKVPQRITLINLTSIPPDGFLLKV